MPETSPARPHLPADVAVLPLRSAVLFPAGVIGLQVATDRSVRLAEAVGAGEHGHVAIFAVRVGEDAEPAAFADFAPVGVLAEVVQVLRLGQDRQQLFLHGVSRVRLDRLVRSEPFFVGRVGDAGPPRQPPRLEIDVLIGKALAAFEALAVADDRYGEETLELLRMNVDQGPDLFSDLLATHLAVGVEDKQRLVEILSPSARLGLLVELIERELAKAAVDQDVQAQVRREIEEKKREMLLREQLRVIRASLGEDHGPEREAEEHAERIEHLPVDDDARRYLLGECSRLGILSNQSAEYPVLHSYFETLFRLPWKDRTKDSLSLVQVERTLDRNHRGVEEVKERILEYLAVIKMKGRLAGPILCLAGPPGTGKTSFARSIADAMGRRFIRISLGGVSDESEIRGHRKTYVGAMPGKILQAYLQVGSRNPVILLDEVDKLGRDGRGDPSAALLEVLDPEQNASFVDRYLGVPFDLSDTLFIATANRLDTVPGPLRDRLEVITLSGYTVEEKMEIARRHLLPAILEDHGLPAGSVRVEKSALYRIIRSHTSEAGVRELGRQLAALARKAARRRTGRGRIPKVLRVREKDVERYLGPPRFEHEFAERNPEVGVATGLAWTGAGGEILFIEAARMPGGGRIEVTGHLGDVMRESVQAALSYVKSRARELEIDPASFGEHDIHIHFPAGAIPKDGPSAGTAIATCIASLLSGRPVRHDVAMTGEITLRGKVLSVGGIKEKVLAAHRAQIRKVLLPPGNEKDLRGIPEEVGNALEVVFTSHVDEVWREALMPFLVVRKQDVEQYGSAPKESSRRSAEPR